MSQVNVPNASEVITGIDLKAPSISVKHVGREKKSAGHAAGPSGVLRAQEAARHGHQPDARFQFAYSMVPDNTTMDLGNEPAHDGQGVPPGPSQLRGGHFQLLELEL